MIARVLAGAARSLFNVGVLLLLAGGLCMYGAYRLLRAATVGAPAPPRRAAAFAVLTSVVELVRTLPPSPRNPANGKRAQAPDDEPETFSREAVELADEVLAGTYHEGHA